MARKLERWVAGGDIHGDRQCPDAVAAFFDFCADFKPKERICIGDAVDLRWLRRGASQGEKMDRVEADVDMGCEFLGRMKPTAYLWGNHEVRLRDALIDSSRDGPLHCLADNITERLSMAVGRKCKTYPYNKRTGIHRYGDFSFVHGYAHGMYATKKHADIYGNVVHGHTHTQESATSMRHDGSKGYSCGCLCELELGYNKAVASALRQRQGFLYGFRGPETDRLAVFMAGKIGDQWVYPTEFNI